MRTVVTFLLLSITSVGITGSPFSNRFCLTPLTPIPDNNPTGITSTLAGINFLNGNVTDVDVQVEIDHTWVGDLVVELSHDNSGTSSVIYQSSCDSDDLDIVLDDSATRPTDTCNVNPAASGGLMPFTPLSQFAGLDGAADWSLTVSDNANQDIGVLNRWCLFLNMHYNDVGLDAPGFERIVQRPADIYAGPDHQRVAGQVRSGDAGDFFVINLPAGKQLDEVIVADYRGQDQNSTTNLVMLRGVSPYGDEILDVNVSFGASDVGNAIALNSLPVYGPESIAFLVIDSNTEVDGEYYELDFISSPALSSQVMWDESVDFDLEGLPNNTLVRPVPRGTGRLIANDSPSGDTSDSFSVLLREGQVLNAIRLESYGSNDVASFILHPGDAGIGQGAPILGFSNWNNSNVGEDLLDNIGLGTIRGPARLTMEVVTTQSGQLPNYTLHFEEDSIFVEDFERLPIDVQVPLLNELVVNLPGSDASDELVELLGDPGVSYSGYYFVSMEGDAGSGASGFADRVISLGNAAFGENGLLVIRSGDNPFIMDSETAEIAVNGFSLENGSNSFLIVYAPDGLSQGVDYDTNDDGQLELPAGSWIVDAVSVTDGGSSDIQYGGAALFDAGFQPGAMTRFPGARKRHDTNEWYFGTLSGTVPDTDYGGNLSDNFPFFGELTPGAPNVD